jgi:hypothetical protein
MMKKLIAILPALFVGINVFCQQMNAPDMELQSQQYQDKSKVQRTWAWITAGTGAAIIIVTAASSSSGANNTGGWLNLNDLDRKLNTGAYITGGLLMAASIPLFIASANNRDHAATLNVVLRTEQITAFSRAGCSIRTIPAAGIRIVWN